MSKATPNNDRTFAQLDIVFKGDAPLVSCGADFFTVLVPYTLV
jgi:hypothetical protein